MGMSMTLMKGRYLSYLLRLWQTTDGDQCVWYVMLESPDGGERRSFKSLDELLAFLVETTGGEKAACERSER
jgi:hypothetical protein